MKMKKILFLMVTLIITTMMGSFQTVKAESPYYTYTTDTFGRIVRTTEAYTPTNQIYEINGERLVLPQHIFVDDQNLIYITDKNAKASAVDDNGSTSVWLGKVYILNEKLEYIGELSHPSLKAPKSIFVSDTKIYALSALKILIFDKQELLENQNVVLLKTIEKPTSPIFQGDKGYEYNPQNLVVDSRGNIYIQGSKSPNGIIMLDEEGHFMTFFGGNPLRIPFVDRVRSLFLTEKQEQAIQRIQPDYPSNVAIDDKGFVYTVTSSVRGNPIKKFNSSGRNYFRSNMIGTLNMNGLWVGQNNTVYSVNSDGFIFEYDENGILLFMFGGKDVGSSNNRVGLLTDPVSIASNDKDQLFVVDYGAKLIQVYHPTEFTNSVHSAIENYQDGNYDESRDKWEHILKYNAQFDYAHVGLGDAYMTDYEYEEAFKEYEYSNDLFGMSAAYWGIRQEWMKDNLSMVFTIILILILLRLIYNLLNTRFDYSSKIKVATERLRKKSQIFDELLYIFYFLKHPFDAFYEIKRENRVSVKTSSIIYFLLAVVYVLNYKYANVLFVPKQGVNVTYELFILVLVVVLWVVSNYLICSISDGEGTFKNVYNATAYSLTPILLIMPFIIIFSNFITFQEYVFYDFGYSIITFWTAFLMFFMIKDIHNYEVKETLWIIAKSIFTMVIIGVILFILNTLTSQLITVISEIITEVINR